MTTHDVFRSAATGREHLDFYRDDLDRARRFPIMCVTPTGIHTATWAQPHDIPDDDMALAEAVHAALHADPDANIGAVVLGHRLAAARGR